MLAANCAANGTIPSMTCCWDEAFSSPSLLKSAAMLRSSSDLPTPASPTITTPLPLRTNSFTKYERRTESTVGTSTLA